jgi:hypothetical protein
MDNTMTFLQELFGSINVAAIVAVFVLVWLWGQFGLSGKGQLLSSFLTGVVIGIADKFFGGQLADGSAWFMAVMYGIILGGLASGAYEGIKTAVTRGLMDVATIHDANSEEPQG